MESLDPGMSGHQRTRLATTEGLIVTNSGRKSVRLTGTAILAAMVIMFDYTLKYSGLKIPFPWMPFLKFDFTGVPIIVALLLFGFLPAATTSIVASLGIIARSGDLIGGAMKGIAELSTVAGMAMGLLLARRIGQKGYASKGLSLVTGLIFRVIIMSIWNLIVLPAYYGIPYSAAVGMLSLLGLFNAMQGSISILFGHALHEAYTRRFVAA